MPFNAIKTHCQYGTNIIRDCSTYESVGQNIWIAKLQQYLKEDVMIQVSGPATCCITFFFEGCGSFTLGNQKNMLIEPNTAILFYSSKTTRGIDRLVKDHYLSLLHLRYPVDLARRFERYIQGQTANFKANASTSAALLASIPINGMLQKITEEIINCQMSDGLPRQLYLQAKSLEALAYIMTSLEQETIHQPQLSLAERSKIYLAADLIEQNFDQAWTIAGLAKKVGINEKKLKGGFKILMDSTVHEFLQTTRMNSAARMLKQGRGITETALQCGYSSPSHFSKYFKKNYAMTPRDWVKSQF